MFGLNDDFALESEAQEDSKVTPLTDKNFDEVVFKDPTPGEVPELKEDLTVIVQAKNRVTELDYLRDDITKAGGVNKGFAMEAASLIPTFFNIDCQPEYFTQETSKTMYKATLEAIEEEKASLIARTIGWIREMITKFVAWLKNMVAHLTKRGVHADNLSVYEDAGKPQVKGPLGKLGDIVADPVKEINTLRARTNAAFKDIDTVSFYEYLDKRLPVFQREVLTLYHSINGSRLSKAVVINPSILQMCFTAAFEEKRTLQAFKIIYDFAIHLGNGQTGLARADTRVSDDVFDKAISQMIDKIKIGNTGKTPSELLDELKSGLEDLQDQSIEPATTPLLKVVSTYASLFTVASAQRALQDLDASADEFSHFQVLLNSRNNVRFNGSPQEVSMASRLLQRMAKEFNDQFVLRLNYSNVLSSYVQTGQNLSIILQRYNADVVRSVTNTDAKFATFIKAYFSGGSPDFFTKLKDD